MIWKIFYCFECKRFTFSYVSQGCTLHQQERTPAGNRTKRNACSVTCSGGYPSTGWGYPLARTGVPPSWDWSTPNQNWVTPWKGHETRDWGSPPGRLLGSDVPPPPKGLMTGVWGSHREPDRGTLPSQVWTDWNITFRVVKKSKFFMLLYFLNNERKLQKVLLEYTQTMRFLCTKLFFVKLLSITVLKNINWKLLKNEHPSESLM